MSKIKYVIGHWTGVNSYSITDDIKKHYQEVIDKEGNVVIGSPQGATASTGGMNSITYNISCAGGDILAPLTKKQCESFFKQCAEALKKNGLTPDRFYTHAEIGEMCRYKTITKLLPYNKWLWQNEGKIDLTRLPYTKEEMQHLPHGDFIRKKIKWYYER